MTPRGCARISDTCYSITYINLETMIDWNHVAQELRESGVSSILLPAQLRERHEICFRSARNALDFASHWVKEAQKSSSLPNTPSPFPLVQPETDSAFATGFHLAGIEEHREGSSSSSLSRYNAYREGFIFSNGGMFNVDMNDTTISFYKSMDILFHSLHDDIACPTLEAISKCLHLANDDWFQVNFGPTTHHSQWHVKRFVHLSGSPINTDFEWLPCHTDPSLISVVIHDAPFIVDTGIGLQYQTYRSASEWKEIPRHGHGVATILVGSILHHITGGFFPSAKHRVIFQHLNSDRIAATLFVRPKEDSFLVQPPSSLLKTSVKRVLFRDWLKRVSRNYTRNTKNPSSGL